MRLKSVNKMEIKGELCSKPSNAMLNIRKTSLMNHTRKNECVAGSVNDMPESQKNILFVQSLAVMIKAFVKYCCHLNFVSA